MQTFSYYYTMYVQFPEEPIEQWESAHVATWGCKLMSSWPIKINNLLAIYHININFYAAKYQPNPTA